MNATYHKKNSVKHISIGMRWTERGDTNLWVLDRLRITLAFDLDLLVQHNWPRTHIVVPFLQHYDLPIIARVDRFVERFEVGVPEVARYGLASHDEGRSINQDAIRV